MFKIESYLTPIILNHVAKYVKDFRPQDAQFSLWQGEVILQNLNMRLDVLEKELNLPFDLISGHIHELSILVPWTKLTSEPIKITINTIEFVLKMKNSEKGSSRSAETAGTKSAKKPEQLQQEEGGLVNKIIKNIEVQCHNIILKLIVEDIVLSMNVQLLSFSSANENWTPAMLDINPVNVLTRKLVKISDFTICLDKRNEAGQIEVCQEPLLYRSNLECRILDKYNVRTKSKCSTQRIGIYSDLLDSNVSSLQFPMIMRLYKVLSTLNDSDNNSQKATPADYNEVYVDAASDTTVTDQSYFSWFWNALPNFDFELFEGEEALDADLQKGHTQDIGVYVKNFNVTLKHAEFVNDSIVGTTKRLQYTPIVRVTLGGIYLEKVSAEEIGWSSIKTGLTSIIVEPLGEYGTDDIQTNALLDCSSSFNIGNAFIDKSLFDQQCLIADKGWGVTNFAEYCNRITDEYLLFRSPILAFDLVKYLMSHQNHSPDDDATTPLGGISDKRCQYRLLCSGVTLRYNQVFLQVKNIINAYVKSYDYPEYHADETLETNADNVTKLHPPRVEDFDALMQYIPLCTYRFELKRIRLEVYAHVEPPADSGGTNKPSTLHRHNPPNHLRPTMRQHFALQLEHLDGQLTKPVDPKNLVHTTCQLPPKTLPPSLLDACYDNYTVNVKNFYIALNDGKAADTFRKVLTVPSISVRYSNLIMPKLWQSKPQIPWTKLQADCEQFNIEFSKRELFIIHHLLKCVQEYQPKLLWRLAKQETSTAASRRAAVKLHNQFCQLRILHRQYRKAAIWNLSLKSLLSKVVGTNHVEGTRDELLSTDSAVRNNRDIWLELQLQLPDKMLEEAGIVATVAGLWVDKFYVSISAPFLQFLNYKESEPSSQADFMESAYQNYSPSPQTLSNITAVSSGAYANSPSQSLVHRSLRNSLSRDSRRVSHPEETVHLSSDRDDKTTAATSTTKTENVNADENTSFQHLQLLKKLILHIEIAQSEFSFAERLPETRTRNSSGTGTGTDTTPPLEYTTIKLPQLLIESNDAHRIPRTDMQRLIERDDLFEKDEFNWKVVVSGASMQNHTQSNVDVILLPTRLSISVALTVKESKSLKAGQSRSRTSVGHGILHVSKRVSTVDFEDDDDNIATPPESEEENAGADDDNGSVHSHFDQGIQISKSCDSISLKDIPIMGAARSDVSMASSMASTTNIAQPDVDLVQRLSNKSSLSLDSHPSQTSVARLKTTKKTVPTFSVHADTTTPIHILLSVKKIKAVMCHFQVLSTAYSSIAPAAYTNKNYQHKSGVEIFTATEENANIKEFMELETSSGKSATSMHDSLIITPTGSFLCQLTITKIILELKNSEEAQVTNAAKVLLELEDLLSTIDKRSDYTKCTCKVGQFTLRYMKFSPSAEEWVFTEGLHIKMLPISGNPLPILNVIGTSVSSKELYNRIGAKHRGEMNKQILEICFYFEAIQIIWDLGQMAEFIEPLCGLWLPVNPCKYKSINTNVQNNATRVPTSENLPILYLESKGLVIYLPAKGGKEYSSVGILSIGSIKITPDLTNPLQRKPLRPEVFQKASKLGVLNTPGSILENRQYELTLDEISFSSADWYQTSKQMRDQNTNFLLTNPAFEWNNQSRRSTVKFWRIFSNFKFVCIYAPCMTYKNVVICGQMTEFNCASDFVATINTNQINLINCLTIYLNQITNILAMTPSMCSPEALTTQKENPSFKSLESFHQSEKLFSVSCYSRSFVSCESVSRQCSGAWEKRCSLPTYDPHLASESSSFPSSIDAMTGTKPNLTRTSDSGFYSCCSCPSKTRISSNERFRSCTSGSLLLYNERDGAGKASAMGISNRQIPRSVALITGTFRISFFEFVMGEQIPMMAINVSQPSFMISQSVYERSMQITLFGLSIRIADWHEGRRLNAPPDQSNLPSTGEEAEKDGDGDDDDDVFFPHTIMKTKQGTLGPSGVPPPFFSCKTHLSKKQLLEIDIDLAKPVECNLSEDYMHQLLKHAIVVNTALLENSCFVRSKTPIVRGSKTKLMRLQFFNADRLHCKLDSLEVKFFQTDQYNCKLICVDAIANIKFITRPEKANAKLSISNIHLMTNDKITLHPLSLGASVDFITEPWHPVPLVSASVRLNVVQVDVGVKELLKLHGALNDYLRITSQMSEQWETFLRNRPQEQPDSSVKREQLLAIKCPAVSDFERQKKQNKNKRRQRKEFYQDDLRAGAFQFVEMETDSVLPLPYQIQIITKKFGIVCWRYPQPRKMCRIQISPIPLAVPHPVHIKCRMEYFSETYEDFLHFCDFWLSETIYNELQLPEREICANIWRVVITESLVVVNGEYFDATEDIHDIPSIRTLTSSDDNDVQNEREKFKFVLHPKLLVGCMRIDTSFQSESVPKAQFLVKFNLFKLNILNPPVENAQLPEFLEGYNLAPTTEISHTFMNLTVERTSFFLSLLSSQDYSISFETTFNIKCLDYGFLNMVPLLEESTLRSYFHVNKESHYVQANVVHDRIRLNFGPSILHTLLSAKKHWEYTLTAANRKATQHVFIAKFVIVNQTYSVVAFGQAGTAERIQLQPKEVYMYSFHSDFCNQELAFSIFDDDFSIKEASQSAPISLKFEGAVCIRTVRIGNKCLIIKSQKLSATQIYVLIKGQLELISMVPHDLRLEFRRVGKKYDNPLEYPVDKMSRCTFFRSVQRDSLVIMRLKFMNGIAKGRSGDIPLRPNKHLPWLVKVPHQDNNFISFWVRILREDLPYANAENFQPQRILITIWPIFEIRSMLTGATIALEGSGADEVFPISPKGGRHLLNVPATHLTEHEVEFNYRFPLDPASSTEYMLSLKSIDWNDFFWYDEQLWQIEYALQELPARKHITWPLNDPEELRLKRISRAEAMASVNYCCTPTRDFSCSLCLKLSPWGMFINATGMIVSICDYETQARLTVESNGIEMMLAIKTAFTLQIRYGSTWIASLPIYFKDTSSAATDKYYVALEDISSEIVILCGGEVVKFVLDFKMEEERRIFIVRSKYNVANFTKRNLCIFPFALDHKESATRGDIKKLDAQVRKKHLHLVDSTKNCIGQTLDSFFDLCARQSVRSSDTAFISFICFKLSDDSSELSMPIPLTMQFTRKCFSLQNGSESIPLVVVLVEQNGIFYLSVFEDHSPAILLSNQTNIRLMVAQATSAESSKVVRTTAEYNGKHFVWHQLVLPYSKCYYTPPEMYINFPDVESTKCNLSFALWKDGSSKSSIHWSKPIRTDMSWEKYLHVPNHGDVKVMICDKHNIIRVNIYYISQKLEFSVKDLRSRLVAPPSSSPPPPSLPQPPFIDVIANTSSSTSITTLFSVTSEDSLLKIRPSDACVHFRCGEDCTKFDIKLRYFIKEVNLNLNTDCHDRDYLKTDIFALYADDCMLAFDWDPDSGSKLKILFANIQIDNQLFSSGKYDFPVVLCAQSLYMRKPTLPGVHFVERVYDDLRTSQPMVTVDIDFFDDEIKISALECSISPIRAYIEDAYLNDLLDALVECVPSNCVYLPDDESDGLTLRPGQMLLPRRIAEQSICMAEPLKLKAFRIQPLSLLLSVHTSVRLYIALDHSPLSFSSYERQQVISVPLRFGQSVGMHYLSGAIFGAGWVVGSLEILGSPSGLARSFSTGLRDFVSFPVRGLLRGPWGFIVGITQGSASLLRNVTAGTVNSMTKLASSVARNLDRLSLDQDHIERTEALRRSRPQGFTEGFSQGITGLGISLLGAVGGIARHTLEARTPGEVVTGVGKGLVGAVTKPLGGAAELLALTGQGVLQSVGFNTMPQQRTKEAAVAVDVVVQSSDYRIWKLLPGISTTDQILLCQEVSLEVQHLLKRAYVLLTAEVFAIVEAKWEKLSLVMPVDKVELTIDAQDRTLVKVRLIREREGSAEENSYTNQRIMTFLRSSTQNIAPLKYPDFLGEFLPNLMQTDSQSSMEWTFYVKEHLGEYLLAYLKFLHKKH